MAELTVRDDRPPVAHLVSTDGSGRPVVQVRAEDNAVLVLDGRGSADTPPGRITRYIWSSPSGPGTRFNGGNPLITHTATVRLDAVDLRRLASGRHRFQLVVEDDAGNRSAPDVLDVFVTIDTPPTARLEIVDGSGLRITGATLSPGQGLGLTGQGSFDRPPGRIRYYRFKRLSGVGGRPAAGGAVLIADHQLVVETAGFPRLRPGRHRFELTVIDDAGNPSESVVAEVTVRN